METVFRLNPSEIDEKFAAVIKKLFGKRAVEITVKDLPDDETAFLLKDGKNRKHLLEAIEEVKENKNLVHFSGEEFEKYGKQLLKK